MAKTKIFWTKEEERTVAEQAAKMVQERPGLTMKSLLHDAQSILPTHRRRVLYSSAVAQLSKLTREVLSARLDGEKRAAELPPPLPKPSPDSKIEELAEAIGAAFAEVFSEALRIALQRASATVATPTLPATSTTPRKRPPKLVIVGLLPAQQNQIASEFGSTFDLRFWKDESPHTLKSLTRTSDAVICMTDWVAHGHTDLVKSIDASKLRLLPGTVSRLREYLKKQTLQEVA